MKSLLLLLAVVAVGWAARYDGYKVFSVQPRTGVQLQALKMLKEREDPRLVEFFSDGLALGADCTLMVSPAVWSRINMMMIAKGLKIKLIEHNVQRAIEKEEAMLKENRGFDLNNWNTYDDVMTQMTKWAATGISGFKVETFSIGTSMEGRELQMISIKKEGVKRHAYWVDSLTHAREWLSGATILNIMDRFFTGYGTDSEVTSLLDNYDWYFLPVYNPDGYVYSFTSGNRLWRKNRAKKAGSTCRGVDLARNFDIHWCKEGASPLPCSETYCGPSNASEPETRAIANKITDIMSEQTIHSVVSCHTFGHYMLFPWGNTIDYEGRVCERLPDHAQVLSVANAFADAVEQSGTNSAKWRRGSVCETLYAAAGGINDWARGKANVKYTYVPELRGTWFVVDVSQIPLSSKEVFNGIVALVNKIKDIEGV